MIVVYNNKYVAAVCKDKSTLTKWEKEAPIPKSMKVDTKSLDYPFYAVENNEDGVITEADKKYTFCQTPEEVEKAKAKLKFWTVFTFKKDWKGPNKFEDYMGALSHEHSPEEEESE